MAKFTRGFTGRARTRDPRLPPGQYDTGKSWPVLTAEVTPKPDLASWTFTVEGEVEQPTTWTWDEIHALPPSTLRGRHPLRHHVVEVRRELRRRVGRHVARRGAGCSRPRRTCSRSRSTGYTTNLPARRRDRRQGVGRVELRRQAARTAARRARRACSCRTSTSGRAPSSSRACASSTTTSPASGSATATTTAATPGSNSGTRVTDAIRRPRRARTRGSTRWSSTSRRRPSAPRRSGSRSRTRRRTSPGSTTSCGSPRPTGTPRRARTRSPPRPTGRTRSTSPSSGSIDGEVSTFLHDEVVIGDELEVRGPIGGFFVWKGDTPALLVGGGSGVVPLMAMLRLARKLGKQDLVRLVVSVRAPDELLLRVGDPRARDERRLHAHDARRLPARAGRLTPEDLAPLLARDQTAYVCGSAGFADAASHLAVDLGDPRAPGARRTVRPDRRKHPSEPRVAER